MIRHYFGLEITERPRPRNGSVNVLALRLDRLHQVCLECRAMLHSERSDSRDAGYLRIQHVIDGKRRARKAAAAGDNGDQHEGRNDAQGYRAPQSGSRTTERAHGLPHPIKPFKRTAQGTPPAPSGNHTMIGGPRRVTLGEPRRPRRSRTRRPPQRRSGPCGLCPRQRPKSSPGRRGLPPCRPRHPAE